MHGYKYQREGNIEVYRRILKYSPFALKRRKGIHQSIHHLSSGGTITAVAPEAVTVEDAEKLYALILVGNEGQMIEAHNGFSVIAVSAKFSDIKNATHAHDYKAIKKALERITMLTIKYRYVKNDKDDYIITHIIHKIKLDENKNTITALFDCDFWKACKEKSLTMHFPTYQSLAPATKNMYGFIITNSGNIFTEDLLIERAALTEGRRDNRQKIIKKALQELTDKAIIDKYEVVKKNGTRLYRIYRIRETVNV